MFIQKKRRIYAEEEVGAEVATVDVAPEATELLFEAEDVAELIAEVTESPVEVEVSEDGESATFSVDGDEYRVEAEGDEEVLESVRRPLRNKRPIKSASVPARRRRTSKARTSVKTPRGRIR